jgi:hypothetical protein
VCEALQQRKLLHQHQLRLQVRRGVATAASTRQARQPRLQHTLLMMMMMMHRLLCCGTLPKCC